MNRGLSVIFLAMRTLVFVGSFCVLGLFFEEIDLQILKLNSFNLQSSGLTLSWLTKFLVKLKHFVDWLKAQAKFDLEGCFLETFHYC